MPHCCSLICKSFSLTTDVQSASWNSRKVVLVENCCCRPSHWLGSLCRAGSVKFDKRMYFLENDRRYCRTYNNLEASLQKELSFYQQKAKEWAEVHTHVSFFFFFSVKIIHDAIHDVSTSHSIIILSLSYCMGIVGNSVLRLLNSVFREIALCIYITMGNIWFA